MSVQRICLACKTPKAKYPWPDGRCGQPKETAFDGKTTFFGASIRCPDCGDFELSDTAVSQLRASFDRLGGPRLSKAIRERFDKDGVHRWRADEIEEIAREDDR